uniref:Uncharacterized protein n=1 Tax=Octopus bimaculoides TaxID=37653 RepID=A0A0L8GH15_OCTBM
MAFIYILNKVLLHLFMGGAQDKNHNEDFAITSLVTNMQMNINRMVMCNEF